MLIYKIFVFLGIALIAILSIENTVVGFSSYIFWGFGKTGLLVIITGIIGIFIGYGIHGIVKSKDSFDDEEDNFDF